MENLNYKCLVMLLKFSIKMSYLSMYYETYIVRLTFYISFQHDWDVILNILTFNIIPLVIFRYPKSKL